MNFVCNCLYKSNLITDVLDQGPENFFSKGCNILGSASHMASVTTTQLYSCSDETAIDNMKASKCDYVPAKLYLQKQAVGWTIFTTPWSR